MTCGVLLAVGGVNGVLACSVPVFRYALERWPANGFEVTLYCRGSLPAPLHAAATALGDAAGQHAANFRLTVVDLSNPTNVPLPWLIAQFPGGAEGDGLPAWQGEFTTDTGRLLLDSPARRELVRRLVGGDSVVWVLLDGDAATTRLVETELRKQEREIALPEVDPQDPRTEGNRTLKIAFSILPVSRIDPAEQCFVSMLLNSAPGVDKAAGPILFPVFGRGRTLAGFSGSNLNIANIAGVTRYLCGPCSCEIKEQNPGMDLLVAADWEGSLAGCVVKDPPLPPLVSLATLAAASQAPTARPPPSAPVQTNGGLRRNLGIALAFLLAAVVAGTLLRLRRRWP